MHYIFVNEKPIILTTTIEKENGFKNYLLIDVDIEKVLKCIAKNKYDSIRLIHDKEEELLPLFLKKLPNVIAGGGKVYNQKNEILFIFRNNKWDLPKGKAEKNETIETTAIREVEEETGVTGLEITKQLPTTYHVFKRNGKFKLKITHWFEMKTNYNDSLSPQLEEDITDVKWLDDNATTHALENSYANIRLLFN